MAEYKFWDESRNLQAKIYSGFPGVGKSYYFIKSNTGVLDSDSSHFDKKDFPNNYIQHIKDNLNIADIIFVSSHKEVRDALVEEELDFTLVYPDLSLKQEYLERYNERGSRQLFMNLISTNWENWLLELMRQEKCRHIVLKSGEFMSDALKKEE